MKGDLGRAIETDRHDRGADADGGVTGHLAILPCAGPERSRKDRIERDRNAARQADLAAMRMPGEQQTKPRMRGLRINFWRMGEQYRELVMRDRARGLLDIVNTVKMCVVDPCKVNSFFLALDDRAFVEQHANSQDRKSTRLNSSHSSI